MTLFIHSSFSCHHFCLSSFIQGFFTHDSMVLWHSGHLVFMAPLVFSWYLSLIHGTFCSLMSPFVHSWHLSFMAHCVYDIFNSWHLWFMALAQLWHCFIYSTFSVLKPLSFMVPFHLWPLFSRDPFSIRASFHLWPLFSRGPFSFRVSFHLCPLFSCNPFSFRTPHLSKIFFILCLWLSMSSSFFCHWSWTPGSLCTNPFHPASINQGIYIAPFPRLHRNLRGREQFVCEKPRQCVMSLVVVTWMPWIGLYINYVKLRSLQQFDITDIVVLLSGSFELFVVLIIEDTQSDLCGVCFAFIRLRR